MTLVEILEALCTQYTGTRYTHYRGIRRKQGDPTYQHSVLDDDCGDVRAGGMVDERQLWPQAHIAEGLLMAQQ